MTKLIRVSDLEKEHLRRGIESKSAYMKDLLNNLPQIDPAEIAESKIKLLNDGPQGQEYRRGYRQAITDFLAALEGK